MTTSNVAGTTGVIASLLLNPYWKIELGALFLSQSLNFVVNGTSNVSLFPGSITFSGSEVLNVLHFPLLIRRNIDEQLSVGIGPFYERGIGDLYLSNQVSTSPFPSTSTTPSSQNKSWEDSGVSRDNYGVEASVALGVPLSSRFTFKFDIRYAYGIPNLATTGSQFTSVNKSSILILSGVSYLF